ncbi:glutamine synthetase III [Carboxylicivirga sp. A043]|uniref:glutamine synthetase III family protein n=1 Tax=Carboxylicivirga litoralis TaxID=2816963 RepID=UPI0021CB8C80|nr:glutamine synthetase III [Carboxylicivirga sp. A043]MCU4154619.1 glutamine synthetase III [Carboxylicivirga sp. A043]
MAQLRFQALAELMNREAKEVSFPSAKTTDYYGELVFNKEAMSKYLSQDAYKAVKVAIDKGDAIDRKVADNVASGMKAWAMERGATHYTHWFQPLTDGTAEKHDGFLDYGDNGNMIESFSGKLLAQQEPDASSFPSGGIRQTFEARGYTAWDVSSPAFIIGTTLCIPTVFISYTGEALDYKTPFLKALHAVDKAAVGVAQYFDKDVRKVHTNLGWEQEYFLIDTALYQARPDLMTTGRTLMGHSSAKDQQLDDHYFGSIPERVGKFMIELEIECHKLGIPVKTRHNEVAPNQFEVAPIYEEANLANDHNQLLMDVMKRVARHHKFEVILHEKPFAGINGSGKHNNWSLATDTGVVLMAPGKNPKGNLQFLTFVVNAMAAVYKSQDLLRASILTASNSHRLGANEAPPAIISVFTGSQIADMLDNLAERITDQKMTPDEKTALKLGIGRIPEILLDNTDRNRTSPFAFTGNRFEFRAVGSMTNCAAPLTALSAAMAVQLEAFKKDVDALIESGVKKDEAIFQTIKKVILESDPIRFNGDGYSDEWKEEAAKRGLTNITSVPESLSKYLDQSSKDILVGTGVMSDRELEARVEVEMEKFTKKIQIEARVLGDLAINHIVPTAIQYQTELIHNVQGMRDIFDDKEFAELAGARKELIKTISGHISSIKAKTAEMVEARKKCNIIESETEKAYAYDKEVRPYLDSIRYHIDKLELTVDNEMWPLPKYRELLFHR